MRHKPVEKTATVILMILCLAGSIAYAIYIPFKPHATDFDAMTGGACILASIVAGKKLWEEIRS